MFILVIGNPIDGFKFEGLFVKMEDAIAYGEGRFPNTEWWIAPLVLKLNTEYGEHIKKEIEEVNEVLDEEDKNLRCPCSHTWDQHVQNVHGIYVCTQCNCRGSDRPSEIPTLAVVLKFVH